MLFIDKYGQTLLTLTVYVVFHPLFGNYLVLQSVASPVPCKSLLINILRELSVSNNLMWSFLSFKYICCCSKKMRDNFVQIELNKTTWDIPERYQNLSAVGAGAYGQVRYVSQHLYDLIIISNLMLWWSYSLNILNSYLGV